MLNCVSMSPGEPPGLCGLFEGDAAEPVACGSPLRLGFTVGAEDAVARIAKNPATATRAPSSAAIALIHAGPSRAMPCLPPDPSRGIAPPPVATTRQQDSKAMMLAI